MAIFEVRTYTVNEGCMDEWVSFMETRIKPYVEARGMKVDALFRSAASDDAFKWIRSFNDEVQRQEAYKAVYESEEWQETIKPTVRRLIDVPNAVIHVMHATDASPIT